MAFEEGCGCRHEGEYTFILCKEHYDLVMASLDAPPKVIPELVQLFSDTEGVWRA